MTLTHTIIPQDLLSSPCCSILLGCKQERSSLCFFFFAFILWATFHHWSITEPSVLQGLDYWYITMTTLVMSLIGKNMLSHYFRHAKVGIRLYSDGLCCSLQPRQRLGLLFWRTTKISKTMVSHGVCLPTNFIGSPTVLSWGSSRG